MTDHHARTRHLAEHSVAWLLWQYSTPAILGAVVSATYSIVDRLFVGWMIGSLGITAVTVSFPLMLVMIACGMLIGIGSNTLLSIRLGERRLEDAEKIVGQAVFLFLLISTLFATSVWLWSEPLLCLFGASDASLPQAKQFLLIVAAGSFFQSVSFGINSFLRCEGKPRLAMTMLLLSAVLNIVLDTFFLCVLRTDVWGAAVATVLSQAIVTCLIFWLYLSGRTLIPLRLKHIRFHPELAREICYLGSAAFVMQIAGCVTQAVANRQLRAYGDASPTFTAAAGDGSGGDLAIATMGIIFVIATLLLMPLLGISQGLQPIAGYNVGANKPERVRHVLVIALLYAFLLTFAAYAIILAVPQWLFSPFVGRGTEDARVATQVVALGSSALRVFMFGFPLVAISVITSGYFQATGRPREAMLITLTRQVFILLPLTLLLPWIWESQHPGHGVNAIWFANPTADFVTGGLAVFLLHREWKKIDTSLTG